MTASDPEGEVVECEPTRVRLNQAAVAAILAGTSSAFVTVVVWARLGWPFGLASVALAIAVVAGAAWRAARIRIVVTRSEIRIWNYWRTRRVRWDEVRQMFIGAMPIGVLPQPAWAFVLQTGETVRAQAMPFSPHDRERLVERVRALAPAAVEYLGDTAASAGIGERNRDRR